MLNKIKAINNLKTYGVISHRHYLQFAIYSMYQAKYKFPLAESFRIQTTLFITYSSTFACSILDRFTKNKPYTLRKAKQNKNVLLSSTVRSKFLKFCKKVFTVQKNTYPIFKFQICFLLFFLQNWNLFWTCLNNFPHF